MPSVIYIPLWFNIVLFMCGLLLMSGSFYLSVYTNRPWYLILPVFAYGLHLVAFYGFVTFAQLTSNILDSETMTLWSAILRFQGIITWFCMLIIIYLVGGKTTDG